jgi:hypothetical protein
MSDTTSEIRRHRRTRTLAPLRRNQLRHKHRPRDRIPTNPHHHPIRFTNPPHNHRHNRPRPPHRPRPHHDTTHPPTTTPTQHQHRREHAAPKHKSPHHRDHPATTPPTTTTRCTHNNTTTRKTHHHTPTHNPQHPQPHPTCLPLGPHTPHKHPQRGWGRGSAQRRGARGDPASCGVRTTSCVERMRS